MIFYFLLFFSSITYAYTPDQVNFTDWEYNKYVKPQLKNIFQDYQKVFFTQNQDLQDLKITIQTTSDLLPLMYFIRTSCQDKIKNECEKKFEAIEKNLKLNLKTIEGTSFSKISKNVEIDSILKAKNLKNELIDLLFLNIERVKNIQIFKKFVPKNFIQKLSMDLKEIYNITNLMVIEMSDNRFKNNFLNFWVNFLKPIDLYILIEDEKDYLRMRLGELNISLHELRISMTKRNKPVSEQVKIVLKTIDLRWRSILKIIVKQKKNPS